MRMRSIFAFLLILLAAAAEAASYKVVVHPANQLSSISRADLSALLMKKKLNWPDGVPVQPVDQVDRNAVRGIFSQDVHGKSVAAVKSYWQQQIFSGRDIPPAEKLDDAEVLAYVRSKPGAIGYVSDTAPVSGVKVLDVR